MTRRPITTRQADPLYQTGTAFAAEGKRCNGRCPEAETGYEDALSPIDIASMSDYEFGQHLHASGEPFDACLSEEQMDGWQDAAGDAAEAQGMADDFACMQEAQANGEDVDWDSYWKMVDKYTEDVTGYKWADTDGRWC